MKDLQKPIVKLFATDLDGTLLNSAGDIPAGHKKAFQEMAAAGIIPTIATGRMYNASVHIAKELELDVPIITYNGALIKSTSGKVYYEGFIPEELVKELYTYITEKGFYFQVYFEDKLYFRNYTKESEGYEQAIRIKGTVIGDKIYDLTKYIPKVLIVTSGAAESDRVAAMINADFDNRVHAARSKPEYVEIMAPNISKASGLHKLADILNIPIENVMAIGDANNDIPMLKEAGYSVVMGSAPDDVKAYADFVVADSDHDGVAEAVYKYVLHKE